MKYRNIDAKVLREIIRQRKPNRTRIVPRKVYVRDKRRNVEKIPLP